MYVRELGLTWEQYLCIYHRIKNNASLVYLLILPQMIVYAKDGSRNIPYSQRTLILEMALIYGNNGNI